MNFKQFCAFAGKTSRRCALIAILAGMLGVLVVAPSNATTPGSEGKIVFVRHNQIYTMTKTGTRVKQLTSSGKNYRPRWSPNGQRISYINEDSTGRKNVFIMSATGTNKSKVTSSGTVTTTPVWSPDGGTLAFGQHVGSFSIDEIFLVKATAPYGNPTELMVYPSYYGPDAAQPMSAYDGTSLAWSPGGNDLAVVNDDSEDSPDTGMHLVHGMRNATAATAQTAVYAEDVIGGTGGECCGEELWSDIDYIPNGTLGWAVADRGDYFQWIDSPHYTLRYPGFVSQRGDKAGSPSPTGQHMVFVRVGSDGSTPNVWTSTIKGGSRTMIMKNGYQPDWQPMP